MAPHHNTDECVNERPATAIKGTALVIKRLWHPLWEAAVEAVTSDERVVVRDEVHRQYTKERSDLLLQVF